MKDNHTLAQRPENAVDLVPHRQEEAERLRGRTEDDTFSSRSRDGDLTPKDVLRDRDDPSN